MTLKPTTHQEPRHIYEPCSDVSTYKIGSYAGLLVSNRVRRIWMTLTMADSFFSLSKILDSSCSTVSCLLGGEEGVKRKPDPPPTCWVVSITIIISDNNIRTSKVFRIGRWPRRTGQVCGTGAYFSSVARSGSGSEQPWTWNIWSLLSLMISQRDCDALECLCGRGWTQGRDGERQTLVRCFQHNSDQSE